MAQLKDMPKFPDHYPIARAKGEVGGIPVLEMEISMVRQHGRKGKLAADKQIVFIGFLPALPKVCKFITSCSFTAKLQLPATMQLVVYMQKPIARSPENRQLMVSECFESFCEARGVGRMNFFTEPQDSATAAKIMDDMMTPMNTIDYFISRARAYEVRVSRHMKRARWNDARDTIDNALDVFDWLNYFRASGLVSLTEEGRHEVETLLIDMRWNHVACCLKVGRTGDVRHELCRMFQYWPARRSSPAVQAGYWDRVADAHYAMGKAYMIDGAPDLAVYSFLQALLTEPGHIETDKAIDNLDERVTSSQKPEDLMAKTFIERVLKKFRHQPPGHHHLTEDQEKKLVPGFQATYMQIQSLLCDLVVKGLSTT